MNSKINSSTGIPIIIIDHINLIEAKRPIYDEARRHFNDTEIRKINEMFEQIRRTVRLENEDHELYIIEVNDYVNKE